MINLKFFEQLQNWGKVSVNMNWSFVATSCLDETKKKIGNKNKLWFFLVNDRSRFSLFCFFFFCLFALSTFSWDLRLSRLPIIIITTSQSNKLEKTKTSANAAKSNIRFQRGENITWWGYTVDIVYIYTISKKDSWEKIFTT